MKANPLLSPEANLLLHAMEPGKGGDGIREATEQPGFSWDRLVWLAEKEKATSVLWTALRTVEDLAIPPERVRQLSHLAAISDFRMLHHQDRLGEALAILARGGIDVVLLKGAGLAVTVYDSFVQRPMYDLDLLVPPDQATRGWNALRQNGWIHDDASCPAEFYPDHHHLPPLDDPSGTGLSIELHTAPWAGAVDLPTKLIWEAARPVQVSGQRAYVMADIHQMLHLAIHFSWAHMLQSAGWRTIRDLRRVIEAAPVDWGDVVRQARQTRGDTCCYWTLSLARTLGDAQIPEAVLAELRPSLPGFVLRGLERHFIAGMFDAGCSHCPSLRLKRSLWETAIVHGDLRHEALRPWTRDAEWRIPGKSRVVPSLHSKLRGHVAGLPAWSSYLGAVLTGRTFPER